MSIARTTDRSPAAAAAALGQRTKSREQLLQTYTIHDVAFDIVDKEVEQDLEHDAEHTFVERCRSRLPWRRRFRTASEQYLALVFSVFALTLLLFQTVNLLQLWWDQFSNHQITRDRVDGELSPSLRVCADVVDALNASLVVGFAMGLSDVDRNRITVQYFGDMTRPNAPRAAGTVEAAMAVLTNASLNVKLNSMRVIVDELRSGVLPVTYSNVSGLNFFLDRSIALAPPAKKCALINERVTADASSPGIASYGDFLDKRFRGRVWVVVFSAQPRNAGEFFLGSTTPLLRFALYDGRKESGFCQVESCDHLHLTSASSDTVTYFTLEQVFEEQEQNNDDATVTYGGVQNTLSSSDAVDAERVGALLGINASEYTLYATVATFRPSDNQIASFRPANTINMFMLLSDVGGSIAIGIALFELLFPFSSRFRREARRLPCCKKRADEADEKPRKLQQPSTTDLEPHSPQADAILRQQSVFLSRYETRHDRVMSVVFIAICFAALLYQYVALAEKVADAKEAPATVFSFLKRSGRTTDPTPIVRICGLSNTVPVGAGLGVKENAGLLVEVALPVSALNASNPRYAGVDLSGEQRNVHLAPAELTDVTKQTLAAVAGTEQANLLLLVAEIAQEKDAVFSRPNLQLSGEKKNRSCTSFNLRNQFTFQDHPIFQDRIVIVMANCYPRNDTFSWDLVRAPLLEVSAFGLDQDVGCQDCRDVPQIFMPGQGLHKLVFSATENVDLAGDVKIRYKMTSSLLATASPLDAGPIASALGIDTERFEVFIDYIEVTSASRFYLRAEETLVYDVPSAIADFGGAIALFASMFMLALPLTKTPRREARILHILSCGWYRSTKQPHADVDKSVFPRFWVKRFPYGYDACAAAVTVLLLLMLAFLQLSVIIDDFGRSNDNPSVSVTETSRNLADGTPTPAIRACWNEPPSASRSLSIVTLGRSKGGGFAFIEANVDRDVSPNEANDAAIIARTVAFMTGSFSETYTGILNIIPTTYVPERRGQTATSQCVGVNFDENVRVYEPSDIMAGKMYLTVATIVDKGVAPPLLELEAVTGDKSVLCNDESCAASPVSIVPEGAFTVVYRPVLFRSSITGEERLSYQMEANIIYPSLTYNASVLLKNFNESLSARDKELYFAVLVVGPESSTFVVTQESRAYTWALLVADVGGTLGIAATMFGLLLPVLTSYTRTSRVHFCVMKLGCCCLAFRAQKNAGQEQLDVEFAHMEQQERHATKTDREKAAPPKRTSTNLHRVKTLFDNFGGG